MKLDGARLDPAERPIIDGFIINDMFEHGAGHGKREFFVYDVEIDDIVETIIESAVQRGQPSIEIPLDKGLKVESFEAVPELREVFTKFQIPARETCMFAGISRIDQAEQAATWIGTRMLVKRVQSAGQFFNAMFARRLVCQDMRAVAQMIQFYPAMDVRSGQIADMSEKMVERPF